MAGGLFKEALESAHEAGRMFVTDRIRHFLNAHVALQQKEGRPVEALFDQSSTQASTCLRFKQMLEMRRAQAEL